MSIIRSLACGIGVQFCRLFGSLSYMNIKHFIFAASLVLGCALYAESISRVVITPPGADLQAVLDAGQDLCLEQSAVYEIDKALVFKFEGQSITTYAPKSLDDYAILRITNRDLGQLIDGNQMDGVRIEHLLLDGNRYRLSDLAKKISTQPLVFFGGSGAERQIVRACIFIGPRTRSTLKVHEGGSDILVENNIFFGAGSDVRGNGREGVENPHLDGRSWGDGISCAAQRTTVRNNLIIDSTDVGMVFFGAPGSISDGNVIATVSRESLGGINLVDPLKYWAFDEDPKSIDYRGVIIKNNWIDARGARIHMGIPVGATPWVPSKRGFTFVGGTVENNRFTGGAAAYSIVLNGIRNFTVKGNQSTALYSGIAEGFGPKNRPDEPIAFAYDPDAVADSEIQPEFEPMKRHLNHLLRCNHAPLNYMGYRYYPYGVHEVVAVVDTAFEEMLGRLPDAAQRTHYTSWLQATKSNADQLRHLLMAKPEFIERHGYHNPDGLQLFREKLWLEAISSSFQGLTDNIQHWPAAAELYKGAWAVIKS